MSVRFGIGFRMFSVVTPGAGEPDASEPEIQTHGRICI
jgi:hypothetical protein